MPIMWISWALIGKVWSQLTPIFARTYPRHSGCCVNRMKREPLARESKSPVGSVQLSVLFRVPLRYRLAAAICVVSGTWVFALLGTTGKSEP